MQSIRPPEVLNPRRARQTSLLKKLMRLGHVSEDRKGYDYNDDFLTDMRSYKRSFN